MSKLIQFRTPIVMPRDPRDPREEQRKRDRRSAEAGAAGTAAFLGGGTPPSLLKRTLRVALPALAVGGVLYTVGALVYALKWPQISHTWFGFHEMFHSFTVAAFGTHFAAIALTVVAFA